MSNPKMCWYWWIFEKSYKNTRTKKEAVRKDDLFFGARDGTRTHTALTTRTSNVLVYHSNTLASAYVL